MKADYTDDVRGQIVGDVTVPYEFWMPEEITPGYTLDRCVARGHFASDAEAVAWLKDTHPAIFASGCEMRVFDR